MAFQNSDLFMINRGGTNYKITYSDLLVGTGINDTDELMVQRGSTLYSLEYGKLSTGAVTRSDFFLVERGTQMYSAEVFGFPPTAPYISITVDIQKKDANGNVAVFTYDGGRGVNGVPLQFRNSSTGNILYLPEGSGTIGLPSSFCTASTVKLIGAFDYFKWENSTGLRSTLTNNYTVNDWKTLVPTPAVNFGERMFLNCPEFVGLDTNTPVQNMTKMFAGCSKYNMSGTDLLNTAGVTNFSYCFQNATLFNESLAAWNTASATKMNSMFENAAAFNQNINGWGPGLANVATFDRMFSGASGYDQPLYLWDVSGAEPADQGLEKMFDGATIFSKDLTGWCVSRFNSEPFGFSRDSSLTSAQLPLWGQCP